MAMGAPPAALSQTAIIGMSCGGAALFFISGVLFTMYFRRQRRYDEEDRRLREGNGLLARSFSSTMEGATLGRVSHPGDGQNLHDGLQEQLWSSRVLGHQRDDSIGRAQQLRLAGRKREFYPVGECHAHTPGLHPQGPDAQQMLPCGLPRALPLINSTHQAAACASAKFDA